MLEKIRVMSKLHQKTKNACLVCTEDTEGGIVFHKTRRQTHMMCPDCAPPFLKNLIVQATDNLRKNIRHNATTYPCPGSYQSELRNRCKSHFDIANISVKEDSVLYTDILRITYTIDSPHRYVCPNRECGNVIEVHPEYFDHLVTCFACDTKWCRVCLCMPYHDGMSCVEYEASQNCTENGKYIWEMRQSGKLKFCPQCRAPTLKNGGCNKMYCETCHVKWCWLCSKPHVDYDHFNSLGCNPCANRLWE